VQEINVVHDANAVVGAAGLDCCVEEVLVAGTNDIRASGNCRGDDQIIVWISGLNGWGANRTRHRGAYLDGMEVRLNADVIESVEGTDARVLKNSCQFREERSGRDECVWLLDDEEQDFPRGAGLSRCRPRQDVAVQDDAH
jgi:hypothetical protein